MIDATSTGKMQEILSDHEEVTVVTKPNSEPKTDSAGGNRAEATPRMTQEALERFRNRKPGPDIEEAMQKIREARAAAHTA
jgi:hypothetical protein